MDERLKEFYELRASEEPPNDPEAKLRFRKAIAAAGLGSGEAVLDLGAKWGGLATAIDVEVDYTGIDLSEVNAEAATKAGLTFVQGDVTQPLPFADASFDCVFCLELLEHLIAPARLLAEIHRVLKADGRAVVSVPSPYSWVEVARELFGLYDTEGHLNAFTTPVMQNLAGLTGFRVERRLGTSFRIPKTSRLIATDSILARSRIYVLRPADDLVFAGRSIPR
ncbi:MAG TPA: class I SAM-dependent methyltransferase [Gaiellaceae bacterium]|nr:class I SAM-dependent methyltransferase [Gaiellaceae bacterium]